MSQLVGLLAGAVPDGTRVLAPDVEFTSLLFPWAVHRDRGVRVRTVPPARLAEAVDAGADVVAFSAVQSATGEVADVAAVAAAARRAGALTVLDATQAVGWLPLRAGEVDVLIVPAYKWLMSPRGTAFMVIDPELAERVRPAGAGWFAGEDVHDSYYGLPLRLAADARRFDQSPGLVLLGRHRGGAGRGGADRGGGDQRHDVGLANRFRAGLGLPAGEQRDRLARRPGRGVAARRRGHPGGDPGRLPAGLVPRLHHHRRRGSGDPGADSLIPVPPPADSAPPGDCLTGGELVC